MSNSSQINDKHLPKSDIAEDPGSATREHLKKLWRILVTYSGLNFIRDSESIGPPEKKPLEIKRPWLLNVLSILPWVLSALFIFSFIWDFSGLSLTIFGTLYSLEGLLRIVSVSGMIGFLTNWIAITMLFKPVRKRPLLGQGLIPAHKERIAYRLAMAVSKDLINPNIIKQKIHESGLITRYRQEAADYLKRIIDNPDFRNDLKNWVVDYVETMIADPQVRTAIAKKIITEIDESLEQRSLEKVALKTYSFLKGKEMQEIIEESLVRLPGSVERGLVKLDELLDKLPRYVEKESDRIETIVTTLLYRLVNQLDVFSLVEEKLQQYDEGKLEQIIKGATNEQLRYIQYLGALLGTIGGLVIWEPILSLAALGLLYVMIITVDKLLLTLNSRNETKSDN